MENIRTIGSFLEVWQLQCFQLVHLQLNAYAKYASHACSDGHSRRAPK